MRLHYTTDRKRRQPPTFPTPTPAGARAGAGGRVAGLPQHERRCLSTTPSSIVIAIKSNIDLYHLFLPN